MKLLKEMELVVDLTEKDGHLTGRQIVEGWEAKAAKRASLNLRTLLFEAPMLELLKEQLAESDRRIKEYISTSTDFDYGRLILNVKGIKSAALFAYARKVFEMAKGTPEQKKQNVVNSLFVVHPEHYATGGEGGGGIECMGGLATFTNPVPCPVEQAPEFIKQFEDKTYPIRMAGAGPLKDGTPFTYVLQQYKDTDDGLQVNLMIWYPAGCPASYVEEHIEHYAVEFCNGCKPIM
jgi:hypothetical protein